MTKPKKQHYIPQFLLRNLSKGRKSKAKVWVLDKWNERTYQASIRNVGHENFFYEYHGESGVIELEELMQKIDSIGAEIIASITQHERLSESSEDFVWLTYFVAAQMMRTPMTRNDMENFRQLIINAWGRNIKAHPDDPKTLGEHGPEDAKANSLKILSDVPEFAKLLQEKVWSLCQAPSSVPFIISDNPVVRHNMVDRGPRGNLGLRNEGIEVYMPLSPKIAIHAICPKLANVALMTPELSLNFSQALQNGTPILHTPENAEFTNSLQVIWAERFVYAREEDHLKMPIDMLRTNPELKDGPGVRQRPEDV
ncbi:DUF4238 domain-containing protein [bacterium]|nr:DUF4238 domain-containing protein [bacterium]